MSHHFDKQERIARKIHQCNWCYKPILKGKKYYTQSSIEDDDWQTFKTHRLCFLISIEINPGGGDWIPIEEWDKEELEQACAKVKQLRINLKKEWENFDINKKSEKVEEIMKAFNPEKQR